MKSRKTTVIILIIMTALLILTPLFLIRGAEFEGSDGQGSEMVEEIAGEDYEPWFEPILETLIGGELPAEIETLFFCIQTGIGVGIIAYCFGYLVARKKYGKENEDEEQDNDIKNTAQEV
jgi:cobalt/nickel transport protein